MDRRGFLKSLGFLAGAAALEPIIHVPQVIYSFPSEIVIGPRANTVLTGSEVTREAMKVFQQNMFFSATFDREFVFSGSNLYIRTSTSAIKPAP